MGEMSYEPEIQEVISSGRILNVLVVDDSKVVRCAIREILEIGNIQVTEASNGKEALDSISNSAPDLVLLDVVMPEIDGITLLQTLRETYSKLELPIVMVTSRGSSEEIVQALDFGANDYVTKPVDFDVLWARLSNQLMQKQAAEFLHSAQVNLEKQITKRTAQLKSTNLKLIKEIKNRKNAEDRLQQQASYDELTKLPNRSLAADRLTQAIVKAKRHNLNPSLAFIDLDNFKYVNDTFGHAVGDDLLREAADRLLECARGSDTVARLGGDEFLLILDDDESIKSSHDEMGVQHVAERIIKSFSKPFIIDGHELNITPSLGFAVYPKDGKDSDELMQHADAAMYRSKKEGKNTYCFYSPEMTAKAKKRMKVEKQLKHAIERNELTIFYQPIVNSSSGKIEKAEALLRWNCNELGMVRPDYFIPIAEEIGLISVIGEWVIKKACQQVKDWHDLGWADICVTVNVSARQFQSDSLLVKTLDAALKQNNLSADAIQLELTEGILLEETDSSINIMKSLQKMGVKLLIDDFGTGYASLSYLQNYKFDSIKIDCSYIDNILVSEHGSKLVKAVVSMAKSLGLSVVSEGVETGEQMKFLKAINCEYVQGYLFSKPVPPRQFLRLLNKINVKNNTKEKKLELSLKMA